MIEYIYIVKCPGYDDEMFNFFTDARMQCDLIMSKHPIITQVEVERNDFGECTDSHDLGTVWSWEEAMKDTEGGYTEAEPTKSIFTKDDLKRMANGQDPEFDNLDNSVDCEIDEISEKKPIEEDLLSSYEYTRMTKEELYDRLVNKFEDVEIDVGDLGITDVPFYGGGRYSNSALVVMFEDDVFYVTMWHYSDDGEETESGSYDFETDSFEELWDELMSYKPEALVECSERKPIPEGMTIEQLVEEMEENEDTVECAWCNDLFDKSECRYEVGAGGPDDGLGWLCSRCEMAIKSRGETLTFRENNYWDFLDEDLEELSFSEMVADSINHLINDLGKDPLVDDFADDVIADIENNYDIEVPEDPEKYRDWASAVACEVSRQLNNPDNLTEASLSDIAAAANSEFGTGYNERDILDNAGVEDEEYFDDFETFPELQAERKQVGKENAIKARAASKLEELEPETVHDLGNTYDGGYPANSHLRLCPECGKETFDIETGICVDCGFN